MGILNRPPQNETHELEFLRESIADLSLRLEDRGWKQLATETEELTRDALTTAARDGRALAVAHPLVRRGLSLRAAYIHGNDGPQLSVDHSDPSVNTVTQRWWGLRENQAALTGPQARTRLERSLSTDGNVFIACFTNPHTGVVRNRTIPFDEITRIITDPEDRMTVWFYERVYTTQSGTQKTVYYPDLAFSPTRKQPTIDGHPVQWDAPVRHVKINDLDGWLFGVGDTMCIAPWARGYRDFLADWAKLMKSLSQFAWRATAEGQRAQKARQALARAVSTQGNTSGAGATYVTAPGETLEAIPKSGATIDAESGRPLLAMIAAGLDIPVTMLSADPGVTGARATAETLDEPMFLAMKARRDVWTHVYTDIAEYVIEQAVRAPTGPLSGQIVQDDWLNADHAEVDGSQPLVTVAWPDLSTGSVQELVAAVATADATKLLPPLVLARQLMVALGVPNIGDVLAELTDDNGNFRDPYATIGVTLTQAFRDGRDPAEALGQYRRFGDPAEAREVLNG